MKRGNVMVVVDFVRRLVARVAVRIDRNEDGMEMVQVAIVLFVSALMGSVLVASVRAFWPDFVDSVLRSLGDLFA
jgi:hypothetical protein